MLLGLIAVDILCSIIGFWGGMNELLSFLSFKMFELEKLDYLASSFSVNRKLDAFISS